MLLVALPCNVKKKKKVVIDYNMNPLLISLFYPLIIVHYLKFIVKMF